MDFGTSIKTCFSKYVDFSGRASRSELWWFVLFCFIGGILTSIIDTTILGFTLDDLGLLNPLFTLTTLLPSISVGARRLHDINRSGWWLLLIFAIIIGWIILIYWHIQTSEKGENRFGSNPLS